MSSRVLCHMDASDTIIYVSQKTQTVPGHSKATPVGIPCVRPQSDMRCYMLDRRDLESGSWHVDPTWALSTYSCTHTLRLPPEKNPPPAPTRVLAHLATILDLLAQRSIHKTALGDCSSVCDSSKGPISFCSSALFIANFCCLGDTILELACQIYMVPSSFNAWYSL